MFSRVVRFVLPDEGFLPDHGKPRLLQGALVAAIVLAVAQIVYWTGGTRFAYLHLMYIPVFLAALYFRTPGGMLCGIISGLLLGPWMPLNVELGLPQPTLSWSARLVMFSLVGAFAGAVFGRLGAFVQRSRTLAYRAATTGLPNTLALEQAIARQLRDNERNCCTLVLTYAKNLPDIISSLGADSAVALLQGWTERLRQSPDGLGDVFHVGQGSLAFLLKADGRSLEHVAARVAELASHSLEVEGFPVYVDVAIGTADLDDPRDARDALRRAHVALYTAIQQQAAHHAYSAPDDADRRSRMAILADFVRALRDDQLVLHYQPKVTLCGEGVVGVEALVRWQHPTQGLLLPGTFVPLVERTGLIHPLTRWVIATALADAARWQAAGLALPVAINLSAQNLRDPQLVPLVTELTRELDIAPSSVEFEITETDIIHAGGDSLHVIESLKRLGVQISIDDFGTGYTSLAYLTKLPIDCIKIDQTFIRGMCQDDRLYQIVACMTDMATRIGLKVVAEGVEDDACLGAVRAVGIKVGQGYHFARPQPERALLGWIAQRGGPGA